jgi:hypothetical protein
MPLAKGGENCYNNKTLRWKGCARNEKLKAGTIVACSRGGAFAGTADGRFVHSPGVWFLTAHRIDLQYYP